MSTHSFLNADYLSTRVNLQYFEGLGVMGGALRESVGMQVKSEKQRSFASSCEGREHSRRVTCLLFTVCLLRVISELNIE